MGRGQDGEQRQRAGQQAMDPQDPGGAPGKAIA
jgi:hypothetical protein